MAWWSRVKGRIPDPHAAEHNLLVLSDIHLGEDILVEGPEVLHNYIRTLNGTLMGFLSAHGARREDGLPWHLVVNGDMFDFVKMPLGQVDRLGLRVGTEQEALRKLDRILRIHRPLFMALSQFLLAGHSVTIVEGNHDSEFFFDGMRGALRQEIVRLATTALRRAGKPAGDAHLVGARLTFSNWFVAKAGHYHVEHGHQYDPFCSFEHKLIPVEGLEVDAPLTQPMSHRLLPHVAEILGNFSTHGVTELTARDVIRLLQGLGPRASFHLVRAYARWCGQLLRHSGKRRKRAMMRLAAEQANRMRVLGAQTCYSTGVLRALDKLKAEPAEYALFKMLHLFWLDRLAVIVGGTLLMTCWMALGASLLQGACVLAFSVALAVALSHLQPPSVRLTLREAAARIAQVTGAQYVVFGHSHKPECIDLHKTYGVGRAAHTPHYLNGGSWVTREILRGDAAEGMTYVMITASGASLLRWRGPDAAPHVLHRAPEGTTAFAPSDAAAG